MNERVRRLFAYFKVPWEVLKIQINNLRKIPRRFYEGQHQLTSTTHNDRYPDLFEATRDQLVHITGESIKILSYGCSTGEECFSLRKYFPDANILGVDINKQNLKIAESKNRDRRITFQFSNYENIERGGLYTLIYCMSVLCRWEDTKDLEDCSRIYTFEKFEETADHLAGQLLPGGLLVIYNSNFRFEETKTFRDFEIVPTLHIPDSGFVHKFNSKNIRVREIHRHCIYKKKDK
jgi:ubiquinone/menaquinone biosynthesis C-methylase UbiE